MSLFIKVVDGKTVDHPCVDFNLLQVFPDGIPPEYEPFERRESYLEPAPFQRASVVYIKDEIKGVWHDHWVITDFTDIEKEEKIKELQAKIEIRISNFKVVAKQGIAVCMEKNDLSGVNAFTVFLAELEAYQLVSVFPVSPPIPKVPLRDDHGTWVRETNFNPLSNTAFYAPREIVKDEVNTPFIYEAHSILP
jgi:hypothetical protein